MTSNRGFATNGTLNILCFSETWLSDRITAKAIQLDCLPINSVLLLPVYKHKLKQEVPMILSVEKWSPESEFML
jgi:hypothetical protein